MNFFNFVSLLFMDKSPHVYSERLFRIKSSRVDSSVYKCLSSLLCNLCIYVDGYSGGVFDLMESGVLEGWCFQTTESCSLFMDDSSIISRGVLKIGYDYYHSWIEFIYSGNCYVFDPCLNFLCFRDDYYNNFKVSVDGMVSAYDVKKFFIDSFNNPSFLKRIFGDSNEIYFSSRVDDVNAPMYRSGVSYIPVVQDGKIKNLVARY